MDISIIEPHLHPACDPLQLHAIAIGGPLDPPDASQSLGNPVNGRLKAPAGFLQGLMVRDGQAYQRHGFFSICHVTAARRLSTWAAAVGAGSLDNLVRP